MKKDKSAFLDDNLVNTIEAKLKQFNATDYYLFRLILEIGLRISEIKYFVEQVVKENYPTRLLFKPRKSNNERDIIVPTDLVKQIVDSNISLRLSALNKRTIVWKKNNWI